CHVDRTNWAPTSRRGHVACNFSSLSYLRIPTTSTSSRPALSGRTSWSAFPDTSDVLFRSVPTRARHPPRRQLVRSAVPCALQAAQARSMELKIQRAGRAEPACVRSACLAQGQTQADLENADTMRAAGVNHLLTNVGPTSRVGAWGATRGLSRCSNELRGATV